MAGITAAVIGVTHPHGLAHMRTLQRLPEVERIFVWDDDAESLAKAVESQPDKVAGSYTDYRELLRQDGIFCAVASLRNDICPDMCIAALERGIHVMAEKPIGRNPGEVQRVVEAAERTGKLLGVVYQNRYSPLNREMRTLVGQGILGPLMSVEMRMLTTQVKFRRPGHWLFQKEIAGGGMLSWLGCHYIDLLRYITHEEIVSVAAQVATRSGEAIDVEDVAILALELESGAIASIHTGYVLSMSGSGYHNRQGYNNYMGVYGQLGRFYWNRPDASDTLFIESSHPAWSSAPQRQVTMAAAESPAYGGVAGEQFMRRFIGAAQGDGEPPATGRDALIVARIVDAAYESSRSGQRITLQSTHA